MRYRRGMPLIDFSIRFRLLSGLTFYIVWPIAQLVNIFLYSVRYENTNKIRLFKGNAVFVSNHTTFLDPVIACGAVLPRRTWHTMLELTVEAPFLGTFTRLLGGIPLPPGGRGIDRIIEISERALKRHHFMHFYPEGECYTHNQEIAPFKSGAFFIAAKLNIPVIPAVSVFYDGLFPKGTALGRKFPKMKVVVLDPVYPKDHVNFDENGEPNLKSVKEYAQAVRQIMQNEIERRRAENPRAGTQIYSKGKMPRIKGIN
ncbi:hypothetical protein AGMMS50212_00980 [Spirochaetia bacterium]|nr:hypothetical protein AGMMS50212_00980 [Spirochaetia bacterium]